MLENKTKLRRHLSSPPPLTPQKGFHLSTQKITIFPIKVVD